MDPKDNADVVLVRAISVTHVGFFFLLSFASWNWPWDWIESKWQRERERLIQREVDRTKAREFWGGNQKEIKAESQTHMNQRNWGEEGEESEKRCSLLESDSIDLHSMLNHVQHSAHMAPLNVARPESVYACALVYMCIYIYTRVCLCFYFWSTRRSVTISMSVHTSVCVSLILFTCWCLPACRHMDLCVCACSPAYTACILIGLHSSV